MRSQLRAFISDHWAVPPEQLHVTLRRLPGGLESAVARAILRAARAYARVPRRLVVKELRGRAGREADVYQSLWKHLAHPPAARLFGSSADGDTRYLFLEDVEGPADWPWRDSAVSAAVCRALAQLHDATELRSEVVSWDYETELARSADATLVLAASARLPDGARVWRHFGELKRIVQALPRIRACLLGAETTVIHGDVHPGNVMVRPNEQGLHVAMIDWSRTRIGSPLEDVASWLHSLGCWEPEARRRHDSLLRAYLDSRRAPEPITAELRLRYWFASASNGLAGAIRYHIAMLSDVSSDEQTRANSQQALHAWERVVRRTARLIALNRSSQSCAAQPARHFPTSPPCP